MCDQRICCIILKLGFSNLPNNNVWQSKGTRSLAGKATATQKALLAKTGHEVKGFGLAMAKQRTAKQKWIATHSCLHAHAALREQQAYPSPKSILPQNDMLMLHPAELFMLSGVTNTRLYASASYAQSSKTGSWESERTVETFNHDHDNSQDAIPRKQKKVKKKMLSTVVSL